jgi:hypothetical protein
MLGAFRTWVDCHDKIISCISSLHSDGGKYCGYTRCDVQWIELQRGLMQLEIDTQAYCSEIAVKAKLMMHAIRHAHAL